jgi:MFS family permease
VAAGTESDGITTPRWFSRGVAGIGTSSFLADLGHEIPTALLPSLLTATLHAPASALGLIEGISDAAAGVARFGGGALADDPGRRRRIAVGGYTTTAVLSAAIGAAAAPWQAGILRAGAWAARGLRVPARNALLADIVPPTVYGRPTGSSARRTTSGRSAARCWPSAWLPWWASGPPSGLSVIPGLLAALAIIYAIRHTTAPRHRTTQPIRIRIRPVLRGHLGRLMIGVTAFEVGNAAATLLILRATGLLGPGRSQTAATQLALILYVLYNLAATLISVPAGRHGDRYNPIRVLAAGAVCFAAGYGVFAAGPRQPYLLAIGFILAGLGIGCGETAQSAAVAALAPANLRGLAFGLLATAQAGANLAASAIAGIVWTAVSPSVAFLFLAGAMIIAVPLILASGRTRLSAPDAEDPAHQSG